MTPAKIFYRIKKDPYYLVRSYILDTVCMSTFLFLLLKFDLGLNLSFSPLAAVVILPLAVINALIISSFLHNTSHSNVKGKLLNRIIGEYCGYWVLYGFSNFCLVHILHHKFSDEEFDPVNPQGMGFLIFLSAPMRYMIKAVKKYLFSVHGEKKNYSQVMQAQVVIFHMNLLLRLAIWYVILGKILFLTFYVPGFLTIVAIFAHINYVCHRKNADGGVDILNIDHNVYYRFTNFFTMGGYYHKNHHLSMRTFNPKFLKRKHLSLS